MNRFAKALVLFLVFAALPLRGYATVVMALCESHHGGGAAEMQPSHQDPSDHQDGVHSGDHGQGNDSAASICSLCAACSLGFSLAPDPARQIGLAPSGVIRVPFVDRRVPGYTPDNPDRPPLSLTR